MYLHKMEQTLVQIARMGLRGIRGMAEPASARVQGGEDVEDNMLPFYTWSIQCSVAITCTPREQ
jgi:hypothetical protein